MQGRGFVHTEEMTQIETEKLQDEFISKYAATEKGKGVSSIGGRGVYRMSAKMKRFG